MAIRIFFNIILDSLNYQRKISIIEYFLTCGEIVKDFAEVEEFNKNVAEMILNITINR